MLDSLAVEQISDVIKRFSIVRQQTEDLATPLSEADAQLQSMTDASPIKWHLAHTTWFFETFILCEYRKGYRRFNEAYNYLFNSYYNGIGEQYPRHQRGLISRPSLSEVVEYRHFITSELLELAEARCGDQALFSLIELGIQHEQQHQELMLTDIKHAFFQNPLFPAYAPFMASLSNRNTLIKGTTAKNALSWLAVDGGLVSIGFDGQGFSFDNERPSHQFYISPFLISSQLVTNGDYADFVADGGYSNPEFWLADGWAWLQSSLATGAASEHPYYWLKKEGEWFEFSLNGLLPLDSTQPVTHLNYYEANAYAAWVGVRLPTEFEWEAAIKQYHALPNEAEIKLCPEACLQSQHKSELQQAFGHVWQWTVSSYNAYPGFIPFAGAAGEYNGKFMSNQNVLRGSSCVTPKGHARISYRNFFYAHQFWQFSGIRLAQNLK